MKNLYFFFIAFITIVVGAALITTIADSVTPLTTPYTITNESLNMVPALDATDLMSLNASYNISFTYDNWTAGSVSIKLPNGTALTNETDYHINYSKYTIFFKNTTTTYNYVSQAANKTGAYYQFTADEYVNDTGSRAVLGLLVILFAIGLGLAIIAYLKRDNEELFSFGN